MGGIAGYLGRQQSPDVLTAMARRLAHRGLDSKNAHVQAPVFMTSAEMQSSDDERPSIAIDARISNLTVLARELDEQGISLPPDKVNAANVVLLLYQRYGVSCVTKIKGAFVFALHDRQAGLVLLARDRFGEMPLYYMTTQSGDFVFASEIKAMMAHPGVSAAPDMVGIDAYLSFGYSPGPESLFKNVRKLPPGHHLIWNQGLHVLMESYSNWENLAATDPDLKEAHDFQRRFDGLFESSIRQSIAGHNSTSVLLTGNKASAALAVGARALSPQALETVFIGHDGRNDARDAAFDLAKKLGVRHREITCHPADMEKLPDIVWALDEPVADPSVLSTFLMGRVMANDGNLLLDTGADVLLGEDPLQACLYRMQKIPRPLLPILRVAGYAVPGKLSEKIARQKMSRRLFLDMVGEIQHGSLARQYGFLSALFRRNDKGRFYTQSLMQVMETVLDREGQVASKGHDQRDILFLYERHELSDRLLTPAQKLIAASGRQLRQPFMEEALAALLLQLPQRLRTHKQKTEALLGGYLAKKEISFSEAPRSLPALSLAHFLNSRPLRDMIEICLSENNIRRRGLFNVEGVRAILERAKTGQSVAVRQVFALLMLDLWFRVHIENERGWISSL